MAQFNDGRRRTARRSRPEPGAEESDADPDVDTDEVLRLLSDEYARQIIAEIDEEPLPARTLIERVDASRATVYRRLSSLEDAGIVESGLSIEIGGQHRQEFGLAVDTIELSLAASGVCVETT